MSTAATSSTQHVPAWKRLGLKLKYAKDTADEPAINSPSETKDRASFTTKPVKRNAEDGLEAFTSSQPVKKQKALGGSVDILNSEPAVHSSTTHHVNGNDAPGGELGLAPRHTKFDTLKQATEATRKSVTFTPDTKTEDTFSAQRLFEEWSAAEAEQAHAIRSSLAPQPEAETIVEPSEKKTKAQNGTASDQDQSITKTDPPAQSSPNDTPEYVRYLHQYYTDKPNWKFNKNKQKDLLKNLFNTNRIPASNDAALLTYLRGLSGVAAQNRVLEDAEAVLSSILEKQGRGDDIAGMESYGARRAAYEAALQREIETLERAGGGRSEYSDQQLQEIRRDVERGKRAEAILAESLGRELASGTASASATASVSASTPSYGTVAQPTPEHTRFESPPNADTATQGAQNQSSRRRKRKARTEVSSDESSSDSSSESEAINHKAEVRSPRVLEFGKRCLTDRSASSSASANAYGFDNRPTKPAARKLIFDKEFLDKVFPKKTNHQTPKKRRVDDKLQARESSDEECTSEDDSEGEESE
ncbi:hypothetical protein LTR91_001752 [Friedmanniomyces endolithicus]|uniref:WKF domain-containing protein n=1 Tax=Friedmanniomyces endolithicus TaxID=329885 RepID=A0AAN6R1I0_9PEZI|nr:hypothetical protein LTS09_013192 [Friedmanniomyces endolithicus]KAK0287452.1 hypothetical protein LTR35_003927 [Friedmanniomyces endolithicus]KAK0300255.1 hypothetical protein LTS00_001327 [Friedmanniomyces endolithicus]KAK0324944.1 hypothetical protein LTR82_003930 [Friedmanniomyces endolithicus]KAK0831007.1 hypothetical protein LTR73_003394 [Friedmanniomyces endolithicus]